MAKVTLSIIILNYNTRDLVFDCVSAIQEAKKASRHFYDTMKLFYQKHYENTYPSILTKLVIFGIDLKARL